MRIWRVMRIFKYSEYTAYRSPRPPNTVAHLAAFLRREKPPKIVFLPLLASEELARCDAGGASRKGRRLSAKTSTFGPTEVTISVLTLFLCILYVCSK